MSARVLTPAVDGVASAQAVCDECSWWGRLAAKDPQLSARMHDQQRHPELARAARIARVAGQDARRAEKRRQEAEARTERAAQRRQAAETTVARTARAAAARAERETARAAAQLRARARQQAARRADPYWMAGRVPEPEVQIDRYPRTVPAKARQLAAGDVLVIVRGEPLSVLEVAPGPGPGLLVARVRSVEGGGSRYVGPFLAEQIVQRAARR